MPHIIDSNILESVSAPGTAAFSLAGAVTGFKRFNAAKHHITDVPITTGDTTEYRAVAVDANGVPTGLWEEGIGTYSALNTLTRTTVLRNSAGDTSTINFASGTVYVGLINGSRRSVALDNELTLSLPLVSVDPPTAPGTDTLDLYAVKRAARMMPAVIGPSGVDSILQYALHGNAVFMVAPANGTTAPTAWGGVLTTATTISHQQTIASANPWQATRRTRFQTSTTAGNASGMRTAYTQYFLGNAAGYGGFFFRAQFGQSINLTGGQFFIGLCNSTAVLGGDPSALTNMIGVGYDAGDASTGNFFLMRNDGAGTATKVDLGATNAARGTTHGYELILFARPNSSEIFVRIKNLHTGAIVLDTSYTTDIPAVNTGLAFKAECRNGALTQAVNIEVAKVYIETDF